MGSSLHLPERGVATQVIWNFSARRLCFFSFTCLFLHSIIYLNGLADIYFLLWIIIQSYIMYSGAQTLSSVVASVNEEASLVGPRVSDGSHRCMHKHILQVLLDVWHCKVLQAQPVHFLPRS